MASDDDDIEAISKSDQEERRGAGIQRFPRRMRLTRSARWFPGSGGHDSPGRSTSPRPMPSNRPSRSRSTSMTSPRRPRTGTQPEPIRRHGRDGRTGVTASDQVAVEPQTTKGDSAAPKYVGAESSSRAEAASRNCPHAALACGGGGGEDERMPLVVDRPTGESCTTSAAFRHRPDCAGMAKVFADSR